MKYKNIKVKTICPECESKDLVMWLITKLYKCCDCGHAFH